MAHKERQTGEQLHTMGGFPLRLCGLAEISLTATASQSLLGLYWVRAIAKEQVANELQAVHFWEGHTHTHTHTHFLHTFMHTNSHRLYCTFEKEAICGSILLHSPSVHIRIYQGRGERDENEDRPVSIWLNDDSPVE